MFHGIMTIVLLIVVVLILWKSWGFFFGPTEQEADDYSSEELDTVIKEKTQKLNELKARKDQLGEESAVTEELITVTDEVTVLEDEISELESKLKTDQNENEKE